MPNRLENETSPYLLQHKDNPVDWFPWGAEAFAKAAADDKPIFLSIGYSTCHWCHVMERESFEDMEVARLMNASFISIKVDREERPDIDSIYMSVCQLIGGSCGWPLNVVLTPGGEPFFVGTYFPKQERGGRFGMLELLPRLTEAWETDRDRVKESADNIVNALSKLSEGAHGSIDADWIKIAETLLLKSHDRTNGGFGSKPKFPSPHNLLFLMRGSDPMSSDALKATTVTLDRMATGGFHDHIGGGFHRYSTDAEWRLPHFEKMLYDQAMLLLAYADGWRRTGFQRYRQVAERIVQYVSRDLMTEDGTFFAAEDADSEGVEGKFYVWTRDEISRITSTEFSDTFGIRHDGNFADEATGRYTGENVLHMTNPVLTFEADQPLYSEPGVADLQKLLHVRSRRIRPGLDTKILVDWNGLMIGALARAGRIFGSSAMIEQASTAAEAILSDFGHSGKINHLHGSKKQVAGMLDDYAFLCFASLELYESTGRARWLEAAIDLAGAMHLQFADVETGRLYLTSGDSSELIVRPIDLNDGAIPSGNAIASGCFQRLHWLTGEAQWADWSERIFASAAGNIGRYPSAFTAMLLAVHGFVNGGREIVVLGSKDDDLVIAARKMLRFASADDTVVHYLDPTEPDNVSRLTARADYLTPMSTAGDSASVYICENFACKLPISTLEDLRSAL
ncbi:MAG: thioredoxin domain-containing protein [Rhodothermales bacterium]|nr:thioredoxin domain-containing protein [Rhodothermales bacterium]